MMLSALMQNTRLGFVVAFLALFAGCDAITGHSDMEYRITGSASRVSITYENGSGGTDQISNRALPWSYAFDGERGDFVYVSAQIVEGNGSITVSIYKGGDLFESAFASGFAAIATSSGTLE